MDIEQLNRELAEGQSIVNVHKENTDASGVIFLGVTGSGKTTTTLILQNQVPLRTFIIEDPTNEKMIAPRVISDQKQTIGLLPQSKTIYPQCMKMHNQNLYLWDSPGSGDSKSVHQRILNSFYIKRIFDTHKKVKIALVVSYQATCNNTEKQRVLKSTLKFLADLFEGEQNFYKDVILLVTNVRPEYCHLQYMLQKLTTLTKLENDLYITESVKTLLRELVENNRVVLMESPPDNQNMADIRRYYWEEKKFPERFLKVIRSIDGLSKPRVKLTIDEESKEIIISSISTIEERIQFLEEEFYKSLKNYLTETFVFPQEAPKPNSSYKAESFFKNCRKCLEIIQQVYTEFEGFQNLDPRKTFFNTISKGPNSSFANTLREVLKIMDRLDFFTTLNFSEKQKKFLDSKKNVIQNFIKPFLKRKSLHGDAKEETESLFRRLCALSKEIDERNRAEIKVSEAYELWSTHFKFMPSFIYQCTNPSIENLLQFFKTMKTHQQGLNISETQLNYILSYLEHSQHIFNLSSFSETQTSLQKKLREWLSTEIDSITKQGLMNQYQMQQLYERFIEASVKEDIQYKEYDGLKNTVKEMNSQLEKMKNKLSKALDQKTNLKNSCQENAQKIRKQTKQMTKLEKEKKDLDEKVKKLEEEKKSLKKIEQTTNPQHTMTRLYPSLRQIPPYLQQKKDGSTLRGNWMTDFRKYMKDENISKQAKLQELQKGGLQLKKFCCCFFFWL